MMRWVALPVMTRSWQPESAPREWCKLGYSVRDVRGASQDFIDSSDSGKIMDNEENSAGISDWILGRRCTI